MITLITFAAAAICNATMDTLKDHHSQSVFKNNGAGTFWAAAGDSGTEWKNKYVDYDRDVLMNEVPRRKKWRGLNVNPSLLGGWHLMKSILVFLLASMPALFAIEYKFFWDYNITTLLSYVGLGFWWNCIASVFVWAGAWCIPFSLFYDKILIRK